MEYGVTIKAYRLYDVKQVFYSRNVIFDKSKFGIQETMVPATEKEVPVTCVADTEDEVQEELQD